MTLCAFWEDQQKITDHDLYFISWNDVGWLVMVLNTTFNNISAILWWSVLLVEEIGVPGENLTNFIK